MQRPSSRELQLKNNGDEDANAPAKNEKRDDFHRIRLWKVILKVKGDLCR
jgi:hypothetical protein